MFNLHKKRADNLHEDKAARSGGGDSLGYTPQAKSPKLSDSELHAHHQALASHYRHVADTTPAKEDELEALEDPAEEALESPAEEKAEQKTEPSIGIPRQEGGSLRSSTPKGHAASRFDSKRRGR